jgi:hypothetical protein
MEMFGRILLWHCLATCASAFNLPPLSWRSAPALRMGHSGASFSLVVLCTLHAPLKTLQCDRSYRMMMKQNSSL